MSVGKKLFVGNLAYDTSEQELQQVFSEFGEVKACFTVKDRGVTDKCKGYGYVVFNTKESCDKARTNVKIIKGRPVKVTLAESKKAHRKASKGAEPVGNHDDQSESEESDYEARTAKKGHGLKTRKPKSTRGVARFDVGRTLVLKPLPPDVSESDLCTLCEGCDGVEGVSRDQGTGHVTFSSHKQARAVVRTLTGMEVGGAKITAELLSKATKGVSQSTLKKSRLIVRNVSFKCKEMELETVFGEYGQVLEVKVPRKENGHMLGYAFVQFGSYFDAARAITGVNGQSIKGRPVAVDWVVAKDKYEESLKATPTNMKTTPTESPVTDVSDQESIVASDAVSSDGEDQYDPADISYHDDSVTSAGNHDDDLTSDGNHDNGVASDDVEVTSDRHVKGAESKKGHGNDVTEGRTVFVRNLPVGVVYQDVSQLFSQFGPVRYTRLLMDPQTGLSKGSAFLQFKKQSSVEPCLNVANGDGLYHLGNKLLVTMALPREEAQEFKGQDGKVKQDRRNLYLAKEGVVLPGTSAAEQLSKVDMARRMRAYSERKAKLSNPNYFVSKTRISVRNLPTGIDEKALKRVFTENAEIAPSSVTQVKILRSNDRLDGQGLGRSKGFGFVEFKGHDDALKALRATNNNPALFGEKRRLIVEFAVENSRALKLRDQRKHRQTALKGQSSTDEITDPHMSKRQKWRLKWKAKRLKRKELNFDPSVERGVAKGDIKNEKKSTAESFSRSTARSNGGNKRQINESTQEAPSTKRHKPAGHKVKGRRRGNKTSFEEASFQAMVNKYRQRLERSR